MFPSISRFAFYKTLPARSLVVFPWTISAGLGCLAGLSSGLQQQWNFAGAAVNGLIWGLVAALELWLAGELAGWLARKMQGSATGWQTRQALAWGVSPALIGYAIEAATLLAAGPVAPLAQWAAGARVALSVASAVFAALLLGEAHKIGIGRAAVALVTSAAILFTVSYVGFMLLIVWLGSIMQTGGY